MTLRAFAITNVHLNPSCERRRNASAALPCNGGRYHDPFKRSVSCRVEEGRYDDAAKDAIEALFQPLPVMMQLAECYVDFILPDGVGPNTPEGRVAEMTNAWKMAIRVAAGTFPSPRGHGQKAK